MDLTRKDIYELAAKCLVEAGKDVPHSPKRMFEEAMSGSDFPMVVAATANKVLADGYSYYPEEIWAPLVKRRTVKNFQNVSVLRLTELGNLVAIPGEAAEGAQFTANAQEVITYHVTLYGIRVEHLWQLLVNDDVGAFNDTVQKLGRAAYRTKAGAIFNLLNAGAVNLYDVDGVAVFNAAHANTQALALNAANLGAAINLLLGQTDTNGNPLFISRFYLVVPPALQQTAMALWFQGGGTVPGATVIVDRASAAAPPVFAEMGMQKPIVSPFITSATSWFLVADPNDVASIEVGELQGLENPLFLTSRGFWNESVLGYQLDQNFTTQHGCLMGFGMDYVDYRGLVRGNA